MQFEGDKDFSKAPADVWARLSDGRFLVQCIPGAESVARAEADEAVCKIRPGFAFVRGTLEVTLRVKERQPDSAVRVTLTSKGVGTSSEVDIAMTLTPQDGGTRVHWKAEVTQLGGLLKMVPKGLIRGAAQKVIGEVWANVEAKIGAA
jgi:carbon monoxide dehydrogenase subunit G